MANFAVDALFHSKRLREQSVESPFYNDRSCVKSFWKTGSIQRDPFKGKQRMFSTVLEE